MKLFKGAWDRVKNWLTGKKKADKVEKPVVDLFEQLGATIKTNVQRHIQAQDLGWIPLAQSTIKRKGHADIYIEKGDYLISIDVDIERRKSRVILRVGPSNKMTRKGITFQELATYLEYGTATIPPRPVWGPSFREVKKSKLYKDILDKVTADF